MPLQGQSIRKYEETGVVVCTLCTQPKDVARDFTVRPNGHPMSICKLCATTQTKLRQNDRRANGLCIRCGEPVFLHYQTCEKHHLSENRRLLEASRKLKQDCVDFMGSACADCGLISEFSAAYDFHHKDPSHKDFAISTKRTNKLDDAVRAELLKCVLLCAVCHRIRHAKEGYHREGNAR